MSTSGVFTGTFGCPVDSIDTGTPLGVVTLRGAAGAPAATCKPLGRGTAPAPRGAGAAVFIGGKTSSAPGGSPPVALGLSR